MSLLSMVQTGLHGSSVQMYRKNWFGTGFQKLGEANSPEEIDILLTELTDLIKNQVLDAGEKALVRKFRQKGYDRKKVLRFQVCEVMTPVSDQKDKPKEEAVKKESFDFRELTLYGKPCLLILSLLLGSWFLLEQMVPLYRATGYESPWLSACGALFFILAFSAYRALSKSKLSLVLCAYAAFYEVGFVFTGTQVDERFLMSSAINGDQEVSWRQEEVTRVAGEYQRLKAKFEDPSDKVFQNAWFNKTHVEPAWQKYHASQEELRNAKSRAREEASIRSFRLEFKVLYRLGLVLLVMVLSHALISIGLPLGKSSGK